MNAGRDLRRVIAYAVATACAAAGCACAGNAPGQSQAAPAGASSPQTRVPGEYLVTVAAPAGAKAIVEVYGRFGIRAIKEIAPGVFLLTLAEDPGPAAMEALRKGAASIKAVEPNALYRTQ
ncbi:MAG: hypothetical protein ACREF4_00585 [Gammaproteobacteria bacterium]